MIFLHGCGMILADSFRTLAGPREAELKVKGSRFLAFAAPISQREEAEQIIERIRKTFFDATHHCFAYRLGLGAEMTARSGDDGEPAGSAGKPMLAVIEGHDLTDVVVVVTRWFGGTKLGIGGLVRAYSGAVSLVLQEAEIVTYFLTDTVLVECAYPLVSAVLKTVDQFGAVPASSAYKERVNLSINIRRQKTEAFVRAVVEATSGQVQPRIEPRS